MKDLLAGNFTARRWQLWPISVMRVVNCNIERGLKLSKIIDFLEVDLNARRTRRLNIAREIARRLGVNYVFRTRI